MELTSHLHNGREDFVPVVIVSEKFVSTRDNDDVALACTRKESTEDPNSLWKND
jgi:hypothetical protein